MPKFPSRAWAEAAVEAVNADRELAAAGQGWEGDFGVVVEAEPGRLEASFVAHVVPQDGRIERLEVLEDADDLEALEPAYRARAPYSVWKGLLKGELDPVEAVLKRRLVIEGDLQPVLERMRYKGMVDRVLGQLGTTFEDEH